MEAIIHAFISCKLDYCNSLLAGIPDCVMNKVQYLQDSATRLLTSKKKSEHITPVLRELHWLPVRCHVDFKILLLTYKALHGKAPPYISDMLSYREGRESRSTKLKLLSVPRTKCVMFGDRAF